MILGIDWLKKYGKVTFDYLHNSFTFTKEVKPVTLKGITEGANLKTIGAK